MSETSVVPTVPWRYWTVCIACFAFSLLLCVSAVTRNKTKETKATSALGGICEKMFLKPRITWLTKFSCFLSSFVHSCNLFFFFPIFQTLPPFLSSTVYSPSPSVIHVIISFVVCFCFFFSFFISDSGKYFTMFPSCSFCLLYSFHSPPVFFF